MRHFPTHDTLSLLEVCWTGRYFSALNCSFLCSKSSVTIKYRSLDMGHSLFYTFHLQEFKDWLWFWIETESFFPTLWTVCWNIICKQSWCSLFILLLAEIWHIHAREQSLNCDLKNASIRKGLVEMFIYDVALDNEGEFMLTFNS